MFLSVIRFKVMHKESELQRWIWPLNDSKNRGFGVFLVGRWRCFTVNPPSPPPPPPHLLKRENFGQKLSPPECKNPWVNSQSAGHPLDRSPRLPYMYPSEDCLVAVHCTLYCALAEFSGCFYCTNVKCIRSGPGFSGNSPVTTTKYCYTCSYMLLISITFLSGRV